MLLVLQDVLLVVMELLQLLQLLELVLLLQRQLSLVLMEVTADRTLRTLRRCTTHTVTATCRRRVRAVILTGSLRCDGRSDAAFLSHLRP